MLKMSLKLKLSYCNVSKDFFVYIEDCKFKDSYRIYYVHSLKKYYLKNNTNSNSNMDYEGEDEDVVKIEDSNNDDDGLDVKDSSFLMDYSSVLFFVSCFCGFKPKEETTRLELIRAALRPGAGGLGHLFKKSAKLIKLTLNVCHFEYCET